MIDHLVSLFTKNTQGPTKVISSNIVSYQQKAVGSVKGWKNTGENEDAWGKPKTFNSVIGNDWQKVGPVDTGKGTPDDVKSISFHHPGKAKQEASGNSSENMFNALKQVSDGTSDSNSSVHSEVDKQEADFPAYGITDILVKSSDVKYNEPGNVYSTDNNPGRQELDKAAWQRSVLEKLQRLDPSRAEAQQQQSVVLEKFQGLDIASFDSHQSQQRDTSLGDSSGGMVVALTPMRLPAAAADWERQAKERAAMEQAMLREDRDRLWVTTSAVNMNTATAFKRSLEVSAGAIARVRACHSLLVAVDLDLGHVKSYTSID